MAQFTARGKLDDGSSFNINLPSAGNFMQALAGIGKLLSDKLGPRAGAVTSLKIGATSEETFKLRDKSAPKKPAKGAAK